MSYLSFACRMLPVDQLLRCSLGLSRAELRLLKHLTSNKGEHDVASLSRQLKKDRTVVQRALSGLFSKGVVRRRQINIDSGGYYFVYSSVPKQIIKEKIYTNLRGFNKAVEDAIEKW